MVEIRKTSNVPIIMLTAKDSDTDYIQGLDMGSDDYFTKPFSPIKLVSKVKSILKRQEEITGKAGDKPDNDAVYEFADIIINRKTKDTFNGIFIAIPLHKIVNLDHCYLQKV